MVNAIVVDDEWYNLREISELAESTGFLNVAGKYQNPLTVLEELHSTCPRVAFIDIEMPEMDGITLAEKLLEYDPSIIIVFITSWDQYAVKAFDLNALDYILKPIKLERFSKMIEKIRNEINQELPQSHLLKIKCFDSLEATIGGMPVKWERAKAEELFAFLLMNHGRFMHKEVIIENLWPDYSPEKALPILQTAICKIRKVFSQIQDSVKLEYSGNKYCLTIENAQCDYLEMEKALFGEKAPSLSDIEKINEQYGQGFLAQQGYLWSIEKDEQLRKRLNHYIKEAE
jgi:two-component SAPR family response regulator